MFSCDVAYRNDPKFLDRQVRANSVDTVQKSSQIRVYTACHSVCFIQANDSVVNPYCSVFRMLTKKNSCVRSFRIFMVPVCILAKS